MIIDRDETTLLDLGRRRGVHQQMWHYSIVDDHEHELQLAEGSLSLYETRERDYVLVVGEDSGEYRATIRPINDPQQVVASALHSTTWVDFSGQPELWESAPRAVKVDGPGLLHLDASRSEIDPLEWYRNGGYEPGYQKILSASPVPGSDLVIFAIQRDSSPVLYDAARRRVVDYLELADRGGSPQLFFRRHAPELWASDSDTLLALKTGSWERTKSGRLQNSRDGVRLPIGSFWFTYDESVCVVARPFARDIALVNPDTMAVTATVRVGGQMRDAIALTGGRVLARDWMTGQFIKAAIA